MKLLRLMAFIIPAMFVTTTIYADNALELYRQGDYIRAQTELLKGDYSKNPLANYYLGRMYLYGYGHIKNNNLALKYFERSAELGNLEAQNIMARYSLLIDDPAKALKWFKLAADKGDLQAQLYSASAYMFGVGTKPNSDLARRYHIMSARQGSGIAQYALAEHFLDSKQMQNKKLGLIWLNKAADKGNADAILKLADFYTKGILVTKDLNKAEELIATQFNKNNPQALYLKGELLKNANDLMQAKELFLKSANENNVNAQFALYKLYSQKDSSLQNNTEAMKWLLKAATNDNKEAQLALAKVYSEGVLVAKDENLSKQWAKKAKQTQSIKDAKSKAVLWLSEGKYQNFHECGYKLSGIFNNWHNKDMLKENNYNQFSQMNIVDKNTLVQPQFVMVAPNSIEISEYYDALAKLITKDKKGNDLEFPDYPLTKVAIVEHHINKVNDKLAQLHSNNEKVENSQKSQDDKVTEDKDEANNDDKETSKTDNENANTNAANDKLNNKEVKTDKDVQPETFKPGSKEEIAVLKKQALLGDPDAQFSLGQRYQNGIGVKPSIDKAIEYYTLSALQKDLRAEYSLGILYLKEAEYQQAFIWLNDAAFKGNSYAQFALGKINETGFNDSAGNPVVKLNKEQAVAMYSLAASNEFGPAQYNLAEILVRDELKNLSQSAKDERTKLIKKLYLGALQSGIKEASLPLAFFKASDKDPKKHTEAFKLANEEAKNGNPNASLLLGMLYDRGLGVAKNSQEALYWYEKAPINPVSAFILGSYYYEGRHVHKNKEKGLDLLKQSQNGDFSYASLNLAIAKHENNEEFISDLEQALNLGNTKAGILMADYYLSLQSDRDKLEKAVDIYRKFAQIGDRDAQTKLGFMYEYGLGVPVNFGNAQTWYTLASEQNQHVAQYLLGRLHQLGRIDKEPDYTSAKRLYEKNAHSFSPSAVALGFIYDTVDDNYELARYYYQMAANQGDKIGEYNLGLIYEQGKGVPTNFQYASKIYKNAVEKNHIKAKVQLAGLYLTGLSKEYNLAEAIKLYQLASNDKDRDAQYQLGLMLETGYGVKSDYQKAIDFYLSARNHGNAKAILALARMNQYGIGVETNHVEAEKYYKELAALNHPYAQYQLAAHYSVEEKNKKQLLEDAQSNGSVAALRMLKVLNNKNQGQVSYLESIKVKQAITEKKPVDRMYMEALNTFDNGDEAQSLLLLDQIRSRYPKFEPAKRIYDQIKQKNRNTYTAIRDVKSQS